MPASNRRAPGYVPRFAGKTWDSLTGSLLDDALRRLQDGFSGVPGGFFGVLPEIIQAGVAADASVETQGWAAADHVHDVRTAAPSTPIGATTAEGSSAALLRADAAFRLGIVGSKGDILISNGTNPVALAVGADALQLVADATEASGLRWGPVVVTPAQITANVNDYAPGRANVYRLSSDAARNVTGLVAGTAGELREVWNVGGFNITLTHQDVLSVVGNRFLSTTGAAVVVAPDGIVTIRYDTATARWRLKP